MIQVFSNIFKYKLERIKISKGALAKSKDRGMTIFICLMSLITYRVLKSFRYAINAMFQLIIICYKKISSIFLCKFENNSSKNAPPLSKHTIYQGSSLWNVLWHKMTKIWKKYCSMMTFFRILSMTLKKKKKKQKTLWTHIHTDYYC